MSGKLTKLSFVLVLGMGLLILVQFVLARLASTDTSPRVQALSSSMQVTSPVQSSVLTQDWDVSVGPTSIITDSLAVPIFPWYPDGHISVLPIFICYQHIYLPIVMREGEVAASSLYKASPTSTAVDANRWMMFWGEFESYRSLGTSQLPENQTVLSPTVKVFGARTPSEFGQAWDSGGSWLMSVHRLSGNDLIGFYHAEFFWPGWPNPDNAWKSTGVTYSHDDGVTWETGQPIISTTRPITPTWGGSGDSVVVLDTANNRWVAYFQEDDVIKMAISTDTLATPGTWYRYHNGSFSEPGLGGHGTPLSEIHTIPGSNPSVHWNTYLNKWVMVWHSWDRTPADEGIYISTSTDMIHWSMPRLLTQSSRGGRAWYATIIGDSDVQAGQYARLYYADLARDWSDRWFISAPITFTLTQD